MLAYKSAWGEDRVYFRNEKNELTAMPASWTDVMDADPLVSLAAGRTLFRANDLVDLVALVRSLSTKGGQSV